MAYGDRTIVPWPTESGTHTIVLAENEAIHCPCTHHRLILGPGTVTVTRWRDQGIYMTHGDLPEVTTR